MTETPIKIKDIKEFCKLYKINIPIDAEFDYYISVLKKSKEFQQSMLDIHMKNFAELEAAAGTQGVYAYTLDMHLTLKEYIMSSDAYHKMMEAEFPKVKHFKRDWTEIAAEQGCMLMSLDFTSANYNVLKTFDTTNELKESWVDLCRFLRIPDSITYSKSFRQMVFGQTNPKRLQTFQHSRIMQILEKLGELGCADEQIMFISPDEIVIRIDNAAYASKLYGLINSFTELTGMPIKEKYFSYKKVKKNLFVRSNYRLTNVGEDSILEFDFDSLHGAPGNKFYMFFKQFILNEPFDYRDLVYFSDGQMCKWLVQEDKKSLPHYEKPEEVVSIGEAQREYSFIWNGLDEVLPGMSPEEKRRIIELVANTCKYCHKESVGCQCWNDD